MDEHQIADKEKALNIALAQIEKSMGKGAVMRMGDKGLPMVETISSGSLSIDWALGIGGLPKGRIIEIYGPESSGKTTIALSALAECQKIGGTTAFIDAEHALDPLYAENLGVDLESLLVSQPDSGEQALEITESLVRSGAVDLIVIDSVAALTPKAELEGDMGDSHMGLQARLMSQALRKLTSITSKANCIVIFINQIRMKIGVMFGNPETTTGGNALKFYSSVRIEVRKSKAIQGSDELIGNLTKIKIVKNKVAPPFRAVECEIIFGKGISKVSELIDFAVKYEIIEKAGSWFSYSGDKIGQGKENVKTYLLNNEDKFNEIEELVKASLDLKVG